MLSIGYFLEDIAQEKFIKALVKRILSEEAFSGTINHDIRNATGGKGPVLNELVKYFRDMKEKKGISYDLVIVAIDGNCKSFPERRNEVQKKIRISKYEGKVIYAIPNPHIERWYIEDGNALKQVIGSRIYPDCPTFKCKRGTYKKAIIDYLLKNSINAVLGGAEYGDEVAKVLNLQRLSEEDPGFNSFVSGLRSFIRTHPR